MDLQLAAYAAGKEAYNTSRPTPINQLFPRKRFQTLMQDNRELTQVMNRARHEQYRTREAHNKQVEMYLARERFQQNATWRAEYDRLQSAAMKTPMMQKRLENLAAVMKVDTPDAKSELFNKP
jgi:vacuolar-type H+-ATPase catalytic subunit A/Vma1